MFHTELFNPSLLANQQYIHFVPLLSAAALQSYCRHAGVRRPSIRGPFVRKTHFLGNHQAELNAKFCGKVSLSATSLDPFFKTIFFYDFSFFVHVVPYGRKNSTETCMREQILCGLPEEMSFEILLLYGPMLSKTKPIGKNPKLFEISQFFKQLW